MLSKRSASMIIGISTGQEICLIHGQVSLSLHWWKESPDGFLWSGERLTRKQATSRPDHLWPEIWKTMGKNAQLKERQKWSHEKPQVDNLRKLRGISFIDLEDKEFKETIKNARKKFETPMVPAMLCKISKNSQHGVTRVNSNEIKSRFACILEASVSTRLRMSQMAKIMVQYGRPSRSSWTKPVRSSFSRTVMGKAIWEHPATWLGEGSPLGMPIRTPWKRVILICVCGRHQIGCKETKHWSDVETTESRSRFGRTSIFTGSCILGLHSTTMRNKQRYCGQLQNHVRISNFRWRRQRNYHFLKISVFLHGLMIWTSMQRNVWSDIVSEPTRRLDNSTKYLLHASMTTTLKKKKWNLWENCQMYAPKLFWNACIWHGLEDLIDILWSVNKLARSITKWTKACERRLNRLVSYIHHTCQYKQYCHVGTTAKQCRLGLFQDADFAGDLEDSKSTSGGTLCVFGSRTFVPTSWMRKKQNSVSHSSTEAEIISLDAGLRFRRYSRSWFMGSDCFISWKQLRTMTERWDQLFAVK